ncbi:MAG TPA: tRNA pseudouridine(55) synthase TruB [Candidatus Limnocylindria bacterium]
MHGVVNLDKPVGPTSHDMVGLLRRLTSTRRIGHAGTLDPLASGVLPILVGAATRFSAELTGGSKRYDATIRLGARSATDDAEGPIEPVDAPLPDRAAVERALAAMTGTVLQRPPAFSARKLGGRTAYRAARAGEALDLPPREVVIEALVVQDVELGEGWLDVRVDVRCGAGTYVRSIARDLGERLATGGYLRALRRTEAAGLSLDGAVTPARLEELAAEGRIDAAIGPVGPLLPLPPVTLDEAAAWRFLHGAPQPLAAAPVDSGRVAVFIGRRLLGVGSLDGGVLRPEHVVPEEAVLS